MKPSLKQQNLPLKILVYALLAIYFIWLVERLPQHALEAFTNFDLESIVTDGTVPFLCMSFLSLILGGLLPHIWKERLVHMKWSDPLPGSRAFSKYAVDDSRIDFQSLAKKFGPSPEAPGAQNSHFYKIYRTCRDEAAVAGTHKSYLLFRDLCFDTLLLTIVATVFSIILAVGFAKTSMVLLSGLGLTAIFSLLANNYARRFVCNALANAKVE